MSEVAFWKAASRASAIEALAKDSAHYFRAQARCQAARAAAMKQSLLRSAMVVRGEVAPTMKVADVTSAMERIEKMVGESALAADAAYQSSGIDTLMSFTDQVVAKRTGQEWVKCSTETIEGTRVTIFRHASRPHEMAIDDEGEYLVRNERGEIIASGSIATD